jgi:chromosome segregation protein
VELVAFEKAFRELSTKMETAQAAVKDAARLRDQAVDELRLAQSQNKTLASLAQLREHGVRVGRQDGRCPLCGSKISEEDFQEHVAEIGRNIDLHNQTLGRLSADEASRAATYTARFSELENLSRQQRQALTELETRKRESAVPRRIGNKSGRSARRTHDRGRSGGMPVEDQGIGSRARRVRSLTAFGRVGDLDKQRMLAEQDVETLAKEMERFSTAAQNAKAAEDAARRVSWEAVDDSMAALSPLLSELYFRLKPHMDYGQVRYRGDVKRRCICRGHGAN